MNPMTEDIRTFLKKMDLPFAMASLAEDYIKRFAESKYDKLAKTKFFQSLKNLEMKDKLLIELAFYSFNIYVKKMFKSDAPIWILIGGIVSDFFPEMGKRLINGHNSPNPEEQELIELIRENGEGNRFVPKENAREKAGASQKDTAGPLRDLMKPARERMIKYLKKGEE